MSWAFSGLSVTTQIILSRTRGSDIGVGGEVYFTQSPSTKRQMPSGLPS